MNARIATNRLLELVDDGVLDARTVLTSALRYMSEADVADMAHCEGFTDDEDEDHEEDTDDDEPTEIDTTEGVA